MRKYLIVVFVLPFFSIAQQSEIDSVLKTIKCGEIPKFPTLKFYEDYNEDKIAIISFTIKSNPECDLNYYNRGLFKEYFNKSKKSLTKKYDPVSDYVLALSISTDADLQLRCVNKILSLESYSFVIKKLDSLIKINPSFEYYKLRARCKGDDERYYPAIDDYEFIIDNFYQITYHIYWNLGYCYYKMYKHFEAMQSYTSAIKFYESESGYSNDLCQLYINRGECKYKLNDYLGALEDFKKAVRYSQNIQSTQDAYDNMALMYTLMKNNQSALIIINKSIEIGIKNELDLGFSYYLRGQIYHDLKNNSQACKDWSASGQYGYKSAYNLIEQNCYK